MMPAIIGLLSTLAGIALLLLQRRFSAGDDRAANLAVARKELKKALEEDRKYDAVLWARRVRELVGMLMLACMAAGCRTTAPEPLVLGERWLTVRPGETVVIPPLAAPARQWYLIDNVGLQQGLGIVVPAGE